jgi:hypothetical protein
MQFFAPETQASLKTATTTGAYTLQHTANTAILYINNDIHTYFVSVWEPWLVTAEQVQRTDKILVYE